MTLPDPPTLSVRSLWPFRTVARELGMDFDGAWAAIGYPPAAMADPETRVPVVAAQKRARFVVDALGAHDFGIRAAQVAEAGFFDVTEYSARCQPTVEGSLQCVMRLLPLLIDASRFEWVETIEGATVRWVSGAGAELDPVSVEFIFAYVVAAGRWHVGNDSFVPERVCFRHAAPPDPTPQEAHFRCPVVYGQSYDGMDLSHAQLEVPLRQADSRLSALLDQVATHLLAQKRGGAPRFSDEVRRLVTKHVPRDGAPIDAIADEMGVTPRTLHRRLSAEGTTYRELADDVRKGLALGYVERADIALAEVAYLLGFSAIQAFHRAFKRWTGQTPGAYRAQRSGTEGG